MDRVMRPARRDVEDGEQFARYFDVAAHGLMRWMIGKRFVTVIGKAFLEPGTTSLMSMRGLQSPTA